MNWPSNRQIKWQVSWIREAIEYERPVCMQTSEKSKNEIGLLESLNHWGSKAIKNENVITFYHHYYHLCTTIVYNNVHKLITTCSNYYAPPLHHLISISRIIIIKCVWYWAINFIDHTWFTLETTTWQLGALVWLRFGWK